MELQQSDIVLLTAPYSDYSLHKMRPTIIVSNNHINTHDDDVLVVPLTSHLKESSYSVVIGEENVVEGKLRFKSRARADKIFTIAKSLIHQRIGAIEPKVFSELQEQIVKAIT